jgi:hypothetical protein
MPITDAFSSTARQSQHADRLMIYALAAVLVWGASAGYLRAPYWIMVVGALLSAALCLWLERAALERSATDDRMQRNLLIAPAYAFLAIVATALSGLAYALGAWLHR